MDDHAVAVLCPADDAEDQVIEFRRGSEQQPALQGAGGDFDKPILRDKAQWSWHARFSAAAERSCGPSGTRGRLRDLKKTSRSVWHRPGALEREGKQTGSARPLPDKPGPVPDKPGPNAYRNVTLTHQTQGRPSQSRQACACLRAARPRSRHPLAREPPDPLNPTIIAEPRPTPSASGRSAPASSDANRGWRIARLCDKTEGLAVWLCV